MPNKKKLRRKKRPSPSEPGVAVPQNSPERTVEQVSHVSEAPNSIEFSRDAKGQARWSIKLYCERDDTDETIDEILALDQRLRVESRRDG